MDKKIFLLLPVMIVVIAVIIFVGVNKIDNDDETERFSHEVIQTTVEDGLEKYKGFSYYTKKSVANICDCDNAVKGDIRIPTYCDEFKTVTIDDKAFYNRDDITSVIFPEGLYTIGEEAFYSCDALKTVKLSKNVGNVEERAFAKCSSLEKIYIPVTLKNIEKEVFDMCYNLEDIYYEGTSEQWYAITFEMGNEKLKEADIHFNSSLVDFIIN